MLSKMVMKSFRRVVSVQSTEQNEDICPVDIKYIGKMSAPTIAYSKHQR